MQTAKTNLTQRRKDAELKTDELHLLQAIANQGSTPCGSDDPAIKAMLKKLSGMGLLKPQTFLDLSSLKNKNATIDLRFTVTAAGRRRCVEIK